MEINVSATGLDEATKALAPKRTYTVMVKWYDKATKYISGELRQAAPARLKGKVIVKIDAYRPPRWARVRVKSPLAHLIEGGTGRLGAPGFNHTSRYFPAISGQYGLMQTMSLPKAQAFAVAKTISERGGNPAQPFIQPTGVKIEGPVIQMARDILDEEFRS